MQATRISLPKLAIVSLVSLLVGALKANRNGHFQEV